MASRRCSVCDLEWPTTSAFKTCPQCGEPTWLNKRAQPNATEFTLEKTGSRRLTNPEIDRECRKFRSWLGTVTADDFRLPA